MTLLKSPIPFCSLKFIEDLPRVGEVDDRLKETLREIKNRKLMAAGSVDHGNDPVLWHQLINDDDRKMTKRRAIRFLERMQSLSGMSHLPDPAKVQLNALRDGVSVTRILTEHRADEIAAELHEEMPWMAPATEEVWHGLRRSAREGLPGLRFNPLALVGSPGIGKSFWARRLAHHIGVPTTKIDATGEPATFSLVGTQRGWSSATPGKLMQTVLRERHAGPLVIVDEVEKTGDVNAVNGARHSLTDALLPLLERMTAQTWECPFFQIRFDMSWTNWVLTANSRKGLPEPLQSRCVVLDLPDLTRTQLRGFAMTVALRNWLHSIARRFGGFIHVNGLFSTAYLASGQVIRARLEIAGYLRDLALFNVAIDSKLRGCDLVKLTVTDLVKDNRVRERVSVIQSKTKKPVQFELTENTRDTVIAWVRSPMMIGCRFMFPSRFHDRPHISTRQYGRIVRDWVTSIGLEPSGYGTHSMRRTKAAEIYRKTGNLRAVQLLLGHTKVDSTVRYLGVELEDALSIAERIDI